MRTQLLYCFLLAFVLWAVSCTDKQEKIVQPAFSSLEISLRSLDTAASYQVWLDGKPVLDSLVGYTAVNKLLVADKEPHKLSFKSNRRSKVTLDTVFKLTSPGKRFNLVETDTSAHGRPFLLDADAVGDLPAGQYRIYMAWKPSPYYPKPPVRLSDSLKVLIYQFDAETAVIKKKVADFRLPVNGNTIMAPAIGDVKAGYIIVYQDAATGKYIPAMGNAAIRVGELFDWTKGIPLYPVANPDSRNLYVAVNYSDYGDETYMIEQVPVFEY